MAEFKKIMEEEKLVNKWFLSKVFLTGMFCGVILTVLFMWIAIL